MASTAMPTNRRSTTSSASCIDKRRRQSLADNTFEHNPFDHLGATVPLLPHGLEEWVRGPKIFRRLAGVHPELSGRVIRIAVAMASLGFPMMVTDGVRTQEEQLALYAQGRTRPGPIVTSAD